MTPEVLAALTGAAAAQYIAAVYHASALHYLSAAYSGSRDALDIDGRVAAISVAA